MGAMKVWDGTAWQVTSGQGPAGVADPPFRTVRLVIDFGLNLAGNGIRDNFSVVYSVIDGVTVNVGDRLLVMAQSTPAQNGIYIYNGSGAPLSRATDMDASAELVVFLVSVSEGTRFANALLQTAYGSAPPYVLGTTAVRFRELATEVQAGSVSGNTNTTGDLFVTFPKPFSAAPSVTVSFSLNFGRFLSVIASTTTNFTVRQYTTSGVDVSAPTAFYWTAIRP